MALKRQKMSEAEIITYLKERTPAQCWAFALHHLRLAHKASKRIRGRYPYMRHGDVVDRCLEVMAGAAKDWDPARATFATHAFSRFRQVASACKVDTLQRGSKRVVFVSRDFLDHPLAGHHEWPKGDRMDAREIFAAAMKLLDDRERLIVSMSLDGFYLHEIALWVQRRDGQGLGVSRERVRQIRARAYQRLRRELGQRFPSLRGDGRPWPEAGCAARRGRNSSGRPQRLPGGRSGVRGRGRSR